MAEYDPLESMLDLTRRLPPSQIEHTLASLTAVLPDFADDLLAAADKPLQVVRDPATGRDFLACDYNADGDSFRSPWSNEWVPALEDAEYIPDQLRQLEVSLNDAFDTYRELYYEGGLSSVYLWTPAEEKEGGFAGVVLLKKTLGQGGASGGWDSIHVFEAHVRGRTASYKLTSTVMLQLVAGDESGESGKGGKVELAGSLTRQSDLDNAPLLNQASHVPNIGKLVEDIEIKLLNLLQGVYFGKTKDVLNDVRSFSGLERKNNEDALRQELIASMKR